MSVGLPSLSSRLYYGGFYLPSAILGYLWLVDESTDKLSLWIFEANYLVLSLLGLFSAVIIHGIYRAVFGPQGSNSNPLSKDEAYRNILYVMFRSGRPIFFKNPIENYDKIMPHLSRWPVILVSSFAPLVFGGLFLYSLLRGAATVSDDLILGSLLFLQLAWIGRFFTFFLWPNTYLMGSRATPEISKLSEEFGVYLVNTSAIGEFEWGYSPEEGGHLKFRYETIASSPEEEITAFENIVNAFGGTFAKSDYSCTRLEAAVIEEGDNVADYTISSELVRTYTNGQVEFDTILGHILAEIADNENVSTLPVSSEYAV